MIFIAFIGIIIFFVVFFITMRMFAVNNQRRRNQLVFAQPIPSRQYARRTTIVNGTETDLESGIQRPRPTANPNQEADPLPIYELPPAYEHAAKDNGGVYTGEATQSSIPPYIDASRII